MPAGALGPDDYERLLVSGSYAWIGAVAQRASGDGRAAHGSSARTWRMLAANGRRPMRARALARLLPAGVGLLNRVGIDRQSPDLSRRTGGPVGHGGHAPRGRAVGDRRAPCRALAHPPGWFAAWRGDWGMAHAGRRKFSHNSGNWVYEPGLLARGPRSPFWPGSCLSLSPTKGHRCCNCLLGLRESWAVRGPSVNILPAGAAAPRRQSNPQSIPAVKLLRRRTARRRRPPASARLPCGGRAG